MAINVERNVYILFWNVYKYDVSLNRLEKILHVASFGIASCTLD